MDIPLEKYYRLVAPRPTILVSSIDEKETPNAAPMSYVMPIETSPPVLAFSTSYSSDTYKNISDTEEFVVNITTEEMLDQVYACGKSLPRSENELEKVGLESEPSEKVKPPRIVDSPANIECKLEWMKKEDSCVVIAGRVVNVNADDGVLKDNKLNVEEVKPLLHLSGRSFVIGDRRTEV
ncbi:MAG: flavin reductase family protein [Hadesarchaea archaeon]|nr:flavin reductase family protein [Hadesarchaea archaeon]